MSRDDSPEETASIASFVEQFSISTPMVPADRKRKQRSKQRLITSGLPAEIASELVDGSQDHIALIPSSLRSAVEEWQKFIGVKAKAASTNRYQDNQLYREKYLKRVRDRLLDPQKKQQNLITVQTRLLVPSKKRASCSM